MHNNFSKTNNFWWAREEMLPICPHSWSRDHLCSTHSSKSSFLLLPFKENISRWFSKFTESWTKNISHLVSLSDRPVRIPCKLPDWMVLLDYSNKLARFSNLRVVGVFNTHSINSCDNDDDKSPLIVLYLAPHMRWWRWYSWYLLGKWYFSHI